MANTLEELKNIFNQTMSFYDSQQWDQAIDAYSDLLALADKNPTIDSYFKSAIYNNRGIAYSKKGNFDRAIVDFNKAIELSPDYDEAYNNRGFSYSKKGNFDRAIDDYGEAIKIDPNSFVAYNNRGLAYDKQGNFDLAIDDFNKVIKIDSELVDAYDNLARTYIRKGDFNAMAGFRKIIKKKPDCISKSVPCYIIFRVGSDKASQPLLDLHEVIQKIQNILIYQPNRQDNNVVAHSSAETNSLFLQSNKQVNNVVAHYTDLDTLKKLMKGESFRLYNASDMSDLEEGDVFLAIIKNEEISGDAENMQAIIEELYPREQNDKNLPSPAYTGSFVQIQEDKTKKEHEDGRLFLWRTYGKDKGREAAGACLHFGVDEFSDSPRSELGEMISLAASGSRFGPIHEGVHSSTHPYLAPGGSHSVPMHVSTSRNCIYSVVYENQVLNKDEDKNEDEIKLKNFLKELVEPLKDITDTKTPQREEALRIARAMLDEIRFLFKASHYQEEKELRIVETRYLPEDDQTEGIVELDDDLLPPRFYIKVSPPLKLKKVILGPQTRRIKECKCWIVKENKSLKGKVCQSKIKYRDNLS